MQRMAKDIRASSRRLLQFRGSKRETWFWRTLSPVEAEREIYTDYLTELRDSNFGQASARNRR